MSYLLSRKVFSRVARICSYNTFTPKGMAKSASLRNVHFNNQAATLSSGSRIEMTEKTKKLADGILDWNRRALSRAITLVESRKPEHNRQAELLLDYVLLLANICQKK